MNMNEKDFMDSIVRYGTKEAVRSIYRLTEDPTERNDLISKIPFVYGLATLNSMVKFEAEAVQNELGQVVLLVKKVGC
jgi:hypothetical protein